MNPVRKSGGRALYATCVFLGRKGYIEIPANSVGMTCVVSLVDRKVGWPVDERECYALYRLSIYIDG